jgi:lysophospholipase L1-like esterase
MAAALLIAAFAVPSIASAKTKPTPTEQYLALGDSLAFGYSEQLYHEGEAAGYEDPERFEHGYVNDLWKPLNSKAEKSGKAVKLVNDGCPGETSASLIGPNSELIATLNGALAKSQSEHELPPVTGEAACAYQAAWNAYKKVGLGGPLHHPYSGSQLENAIEVIANAANVEHKPVTYITLNIGANDELHSVSKLEGEAKAYVEAKVVKVGEEAVYAKLKKVGEEAVYAKLHKVAEEAVYAKLHKVAEEAVAAKLHKVAEEDVHAKVAEHVYIECSEKAYGETGGEEPAYAEHREACLATEGEKLGGEYYAAHQAELEKEGEEAAYQYYGEHKAQLEKEGEEAAGQYYAEHKAQLEKEGEEAANQYYVEHKAQLEKEGKEAGEKYYAEHAFSLGAEGEEYFAKRLGETAPALFKQIVSNISGILVAIRDGGSLGLDHGHAVNYTGAITFQGGYNPYGKLFQKAYEAVQFVEEHGGRSGPYALIDGRCETHSLSLKEEEERIAAGCTAADVFPFNGLVGILNNSEYETVHGGYAACMSFPNKEFNNGNPTTEPERLKNWTNMTNGSQSNGKYNGPDIHPTPTGYSVLAKEMIKEQGGKCKKEGLPGF